MHDDALTWRTDGFHLDLLHPPDDASPLRQVIGLYALCAPGVIAAMLDPGYLPLLATLLLPLPTALLWAVFRPRKIRIDVDHQRISILDPFGSRRSVELRLIRHVHLRPNGLELELQDGGRFPLHAPTSYPLLSWLAAHIGELRDEVTNFEADLRARSQEILQVARMSRVARSE